MTIKPLGKLVRTFLMGFLTINPALAQNAVDATAPKKSDYEFQLDNLIRVRTLAGASREGLNVFVIRKPADQLYITDLPFGPTERQAINLFSVTKEGQAIPATFGKHEPTEYTGTLENYIQRCADDVCLIKEGDYRIVRFDLSGTPVVALLYRPAFNLPMRDGNRYIAGKNW